MMHDAEALNRIAQLRAKQAAGTLTLDEQKEAIIFLRGLRKTAYTTSTEAKPRASGKKAAKSIDALFDELEST